MNSQRVNLAFNTSDRFGAKTIGQPQPERHAAARAFIESLAQLEQTFEPVESEPVESEPVESEPVESEKQLPPQKSPETADASDHSTPESAQFSLSSFEDAIADLEQFIQSNRSSEPM